MLETVRWACRGLPFLTLETDYGRKKGLMAGVGVGPELEVRSEAVAQW